jgi:hypothetical protein
MATTSSGLHEVVVYLSEIKRSLFLRAGMRGKTELGKGDYCHGEKRSEMTIVSEPIREAR